jgi:hypothetical protein
MVNDYLELKESIEKETGFAITFEGTIRQIRPSFATFEVVAIIIHVRVRDSGF